MALQFDLSAIPAGATIESATLSLYCYEDPQPDYAVPYEVHAITTPWDELEATWTDAESSKTWQSAGGDFLADTIDTVTFPGTSTSLWNSFDITSAVRSFVSNPSANHGIILFSAQHSGEGALWYSSQGPIDSLRPKVTVTYSTTSVKPRFAQKTLVTMKSSDRYCGTFAVDGRIVPSSAVTRSGVRVQTYSSTTGQRSGAREVTAK